MRIKLTKPLFAWECFEGSPTLKTIKQFLASIPDGPLLEGLRNWRGRGHNDYPVQVLWGVVLLTRAEPATQSVGCVATHQAGRFTSVHGTSRRTL